MNTHGLETSHNITQRLGPPKYNNGMLGVQFEFESPCTPFRASHLLYCEGPRNLFNKFVIDTCNCERVLRDLGRINEVCCKRNHVFSLIKN